MAAEIPGPNLAIGECQAGSKQERTDQGKSEGSKKALHKEQRKRKPSSNCTNHAEDCALVDAIMYIDQDAYTCICQAVINKW